MRKAWYIFDGDLGEGWGLDVVAESLEAAKAYVRSEFEDEAPLEGYEVLGAAIADLDTGTIIEGMDGLVRECYSYCEGTCPLCNRKRRLLRLFNEYGEICCADCEQKLMEDAIMGE